MRFRRKEPSQGLLAPEIWVTHAELRSRYPDTMLFAVVGFCRWCTQEAWLTREEVQPDAWLILHTSSYISQIRNGGHGQFAGNSGMKPEVLDDIEAGLERLGLSELHAIFRRFRHTLEADRALRRKVMAGYGFGDVPDVIRDLDDAFYESEDPKRFYPRAESWLRKAPTVVAWTPRETRARQAAILASNKLLDRRRAQASRRSPREVVVDAVLGLWDKTGLRRPGEHWYEEARRRVAAAPNWAQDVTNGLAKLLPPFDPAVQDGDHEKVDEILAAYREIHARYGLEATSRWPSDLRFYAYQLQYAGERLGREDLLEKAAEAWNRGIVAGLASPNYDMGGAWRSLGQTRVELGRLNERHVPAVRNALDAFDSALAIDSTATGVRATFDYPAIDLLGRAEAHLVLATQQDRAEHLQAATDAIVQAWPLLRPAGRMGHGRWRAAAAELLTMLPPDQVRARDRARALNALDREIAWELEEDGGPRANAMRLKRLRRMRAALAGE